MTLANSPLAVTPLDDGAIWRVAIGGSKGNILDGAVMQALAGLFRDAAAAPHLKAICLEGQGAHFSFGASVAEHLPPHAGPMLAAFHGALLAMIDSAVPVLAAVRGQCLGGGLELALSGHLIFVAPDASLGQPEMKLGVIAPAGSSLLPEVAGPTLALDLLLSGRSISGTEAAAAGIAKEAVADPEQAALAYFEEHLKPRSASSLRLAVKAARLELVARAKAKLAAVEQVYLDELMKTRDAVEGLEAFIAKRPAKWEHR